MEAASRLTVRVLQGLLFVGIIGIVLCLWKALWLGALGFAGLVALVLFVFLHLRCPRCGEAMGADQVGNKGWDDDPKRGPSPTAGDCTTCGRARDNVLPFQYLVARERWDGEQP